ncbi:MAG TPA: aminotransferase class V-fold PLP-dependent enzyme, partial [Solirubrobacteraceae bacterium]|nr:aminotransferase class V-fold PLP-dependent enzyme [Solirubrobacteraceae bacterium]
MLDPEALRGEFPVLERLAYLNAGTDGPLATRAVEASREMLELEASEGRYRTHFERRRELSNRLRAGYAARLGAEPCDVALTSCTSEGIATVITGLDLGPDAEILTSDEEHPGLLHALEAARELRGAQVRYAPLPALADAVGPRTALVACSHVGWVSGLLAPAALRETGVPFLLDGAQGIGAVGVDVQALGCDYYSGAGQKWLCGPDGLGMLYVKPGQAEAIAATRRGFLAYEDGELHTDARRLDAMAIPAEALALALAALEILDRAGWPEVYTRAAALAAQLAEGLRERGREV